MIPVVICLAITLWRIFDTASEIGMTAELQNFPDEFSGFYDSVAQSIDLTCNTQNLRWKMLLNMTQVVYGFYDCHFFTGDRCVTDKSCCGHSVCRKYVKASVRIEDQ